MNPDHRERVFGFDVGARRVGVACGSRLTGGAQPLELIPRPADEFDWLALDRLVREWRPDALVVGLPLTLDGGEQTASTLARTFGARAATRYALPVIFQDERHSSQEAATRFAAARRDGTRRRRDAATLDSLAAVIIVERFFAGPLPPMPVSPSTHKDR
ncbi:MAG: Holliday junction resolvase RuvX [Lysobacterales bacterium]